MRVLKDAAGRINQDDLSVQLAATRGKDELDELSASFRVMIDSILSMVESIGAAGNRVDARAHDIDRGNNAMLAIMQQVTRTTKELSIGSQKIAEDLAETVMIVEPRR